MTKATLSRDNLSAKVLSGIRQHLGCEAVKEVSISEVAEIDAISSWRVTVIDSRPTTRLFMLRMLSATASTCRPIIEQ
jgi:hypothetical protein